MDYISDLVGDSFQMSRLEFAFLFYSTNWVDSLC